MGSENKENNAEIINEHNLSPSKAKEVKVKATVENEYDAREVTIKTIVGMARARDAARLGSQLSNLGAKEERSSSPKTVARSNSPTEKKPGMER